MADAFYNDMSTVARELLEEFGATWSITRTTGEDIDDVTGAVTPGTDTVYYPKGVLTNYNNNQIGQGLIQAGDRLLILDDTVEPLLDDKPTIGGQAWNVISVEISEPAGVPLIYKVQVRG